MVILATFPIASDASKPWGQIDRYRAGMTKAEAKQVGLRNCNRSHGEVVCQPTADIIFAGVIAEYSEIHLDEKHGYVTSIKSQFPLENDAVIYQEMRKAFGEKPEMDSTKSYRFVWDRNDDFQMYLLVTRYQVTRRTAIPDKLCITVLATYTPYREHRFKREAAAKKVDREKVGSFNSR